MAINNSLSGAASSLIQSHENTTSMFRADGARAAAMYSSSPKDADRRSQVNDLTTTNEFPSSVSRPESKKEHPIILPEINNNLYEVNR